MYIYDMTAHPTSGSTMPGTYGGLVDKNQRGGINHILDIGENAI